MDRVGRIKRYSAQIGILFDNSVDDILSTFRSVPKLEDGTMFSFDSLTRAKQIEIENKFRKLHSVVKLAIENGVKLEWKKSNDETDELINSILGKGLSDNNKFDAWFNRNTEARDAFIKRTESGMNLSDRIWKPVKQLREEMEVAMTVSIGEGESASTMSRKVKKYLNDPDLMFRRFRYKVGEDKDGNAVYAKKWKKRVKQADGSYKFIDYDKDSYKVGKGVYKSASKNAMRVARTETNIAYRRADNARWQNLDFVIGQEIKTVHDHEDGDICDTLKGRYPADFIFDGWHPQCMCYSNPILLSEDEIIAMSKAMLKGEPYKPKSKPITELPDNFKDWVVEHKSYIEKKREEGKEPYFIRNNSNAVDEILKEKQKELTTIEKADIRHKARTTAQKASIKKRWEDRNKKLELVNKTANNIINVAKDYGEVDYSILEEALKSGQMKDIQEATKATAKAVSEMKKKEKALSDIIPNIHDWHKQFTINELTVVHDSVSKTIDDWLKKYGYNDILTNKNHSVNKLTFEIGLVQSSSYKTKDVAISAYNSMLSRVQDSIDWDVINMDFSDLYSYKTKSSVYKKMITDIKASIGSGDKTLSKKLIADAKVYRDKIEKSRKPKGLTINDVLSHKPKNINTTIQTSEVDLYALGISEEEWIKRNCNVSSDTAKDYNSAVYGFTYQWDFEIRAVQRGNNVISRYGHSQQDILKKAIDVEDFIANAPKWDGGETRRGLSLSIQDVDRMRQSLMNGTYQDFGTASWSIKSSIAEEFSSYSIGKYNDFGEINTERVVLVCDKQKRGASIVHLSYYKNEHEILCSKQSRYEYVSEKKIGNILFIYVRCIY